MSIEELKEELHKRINAMEDENLLEQLNSFIEMEQSLEDRYVLTKAEGAAVEAGLEDYRKGRVISDEALEKEMDEWQKM